MNKGSSPGGIGKSMRSKVSCNAEDKAATLGEVNASDLDANPTENNLDESPLEKLLIAETEGDVENMMSQDTCSQITSKQKSAETEHAKAKANRVDPKTPAKERLAAAKKNLVHLQKAHVDLNEAIARHEVYKKQLIKESKDVVDLTMKNHVISDAAKVEVFNAMAKNAAGPTVVNCDLETPSALAEYKKLWKDAGKESEMPVAETRMHCPTYGRGGLAPNPNPAWNVVKGDTNFPPCVRDPAVCGGNGYQGCSSRHLLGPINQVPDTCAKVNKHDKTDFTACHKPPICACPPGMKCRSICNSGACSWISFRNFEHVQCALGKRPDKTKRGITCANSEFINVKHIALVGLEGQAESLTKKMNFNLPYISGFESLVMTGPTNTMTQIYAGRWECAAWKTKGKACKIHLPLDREHVEGKALELYTQGRLGQLIRTTGAGGEILGVTDFKAYMSEVRTLACSPFMPCSLYIHTMSGFSPVPFGYMGISTHSRQFPPGMGKGRVALNLVSPYNANDADKHAVWLGRGIVCPPTNICDIQIRADVKMVGKKKLYGPTKHNNENVQSVRQAILMWDLKPSTTLRIRTHSCPDVKNCRNPPAKLNSGTETAYTVQLMSKWCRTPGPTHGGGKWSKQSNEVRPMYRPFTEDKAIRDMVAIDTAAFKAEATCTSTSSCVSPAIKKGFARCKELVKNPSYGTPYSLGKPKCLIAASASRYARSGYTWEYAARIKEDINDPFVCKPWECGASGIAYHTSETTPLSCGSMASFMRYPKDGDVSSLKAAYEKKDYGNLKVPYGYREMFLRINEAYANHFTCQNAHQYRCPVKQLPSSEPVVCKDKAHECPGFQKPPSVGLGKPSNEVGSNLFNASIPCESPALVANQFFNNSFVKDKQFSKTLPNVGVPRFLEGFTHSQMMGTNKGMRIIKPHRAMSARLLSRDGLCVLSGAVEKIDNERGAFLKLPDWCVPTACIVTTIAQVPSSCDKDSRRSADCNDPKQMSLLPVQICPDGFAQLLDGVHGEKNDNSFFSLEGTMFSRSVPTALSLDAAWAPYGESYQSPGISYHEIAKNAGICILTGFIKATVKDTSKMNLGKISLDKCKGISSDSPIMVSINNEEKTLGDFVRQENAKSQTLAKLVITEGVMTLDFGKHKPAQGAEIFVSLAGVKVYAGKDVGFIGWSGVKLHHAGHTELSCLEKTKTQAKSSGAKCEKKTLETSFDECVKSAQQTSAKVNLIASPGGSDWFAGLCLFSGIVKFEKFAQEPGLVAFLPVGSPPEGSSQCFPMNILRLVGRDPNTGLLYSFTVEPQGTLRLDAHGEAVWKAKGGKGHFALSLDGAWYDPDAMDKPEEALDVKHGPRRGRTSEEAFITGDYCALSGITYSDFLSRTFGAFGKPQTLLEAKHLNHKSSCLELARTYSIPAPGFERLQQAPVEWKITGKNHIVSMNRANSADPVIQRRSLIKDVVIPVAHAGFLHGALGTARIGYMKDLYKRNRWQCRCWVQKRLICSRITGGFRCDQFKRLVRATGGPLFPFDKFGVGDSWASTPTQNRDQCKYEDLEQRCREPCTTRLLAL